MYPQYQNLIINDNLIKRNSDFCFFDAVNFKLYKLNEDGFAILNAIVNQEFQQLDLEDEQIICFIKSCLENKILIQKE